MKNAKSTTCTRKRVLEYYENRLCSSGRLWMVAARQVNKERLTRELTYTLAHYISDCIDVVVEHVMLAFNFLRQN